MCMNARATRIFRTVSLIVVGLAAAGLEADGKPAFSWPGGARAAVSLAYDDGLDSHLDIALPALNRYGFKGSFYLTLSSTAVRDRLEEWRAPNAPHHASRRRRARPVRLEVAAEAASVAAKRPGAACLSDVCPLRHGASGEYPAPDR